MITRIYVGIDISSKWFDVCTSLDTDAKSVRYKQSPQARQSFVESLAGLGECVHVCLEHTGGYETPLALACLEAGLVVSVLDGALLSNYRKSFGIAKSKTDSQDARLLARYCRERHPAPWFPVPEEYGTLRELVRHRQRLIATRTAWGNRCSRETCSPLVSQQRKALLDSLGSQAKEAQRAILQHMKSHPNLKESMRLLVSIPGVAVISASRVLAEAGPISNYPSAKSLALAAGLTPIARQSGLAVPCSKLPVYGNHELRGALYFPAVVCFGQKQGVWSLMERVQSRGNKLKMTVIVAGMRKLAHVVWGVLTHKEPYDPNKP